MSTRTRLVTGGGEKDFPGYLLSYEKGASDATGSMDDELRWIGTPQALAANQFTRAGYKYVNWTGSDGNTYADKANVTGEGYNGKTFYVIANWEEKTVPSYNSLSSYTPAELAEVTEYLNDLSALELATDSEYLKIKGWIGQTYNFGNYKSGSTLYNSTSVAANRAITCRLIGVMHDDLSDGSGKAAFTFMHTHVVPYAYQMNTSNTNSGGWKSSYMRATNLSSTGEVWTSYPATLTADGVIKAVNKKTNNTGNTSSASAVTVTSDKLWIPSGQEIYGDYGSSFYSSSYAALAAAEGTQYDYFKNLPVTYSSYSNLGNLTIPKMNNGSDYASHQGSLSTGYWWLRSPYAGSGSYFLRVYSDGYLGHGYASNGLGLAPCFAI